MQTSPRFLSRRLLAVPLCAGLLLAAAPLAATAQDDSQPIASPACSKEHLEAATSTQTFYLKNATTQAEANEVIVGIRNILCPSAKIMLLPSQNAVVLNATPDELRITRKLINELDRPHRNYRLTVTLTTLDNGQRSGTQHFTVILVSGQRIQLKQGSKIPIVTGATKPDSSSIASQVQYLDIGANFDFTVDEVSNGLRLKSKVEQSSVAPEQTNTGFNDPVIRQMVIEGTSLITVGKPLILGSVDIIGSNRRLDISVEVEPLT